MCYALEEVALSVSEIIHRVDFPISAGAVMGSLDYAIHDGVAEVHVRRSHVDFCAKHSGAFVKLSFVHAFEEIEILLYRPIAVRRRGAGSGGCAFLCGNLFGCLVVDICFPFFDHAYCQIIELGEIIGGISLVLTPVKAEPMDVFTDGVDIFCVLLYGVGVIETQEAFAAEFFSGTKIHTYGFCVADMEIAVGFGRKTGLESSSVLSFLEVINNYLLNKTEPFGFFGSFCVF